VGCHGSEEEASLGDIAAAQANLDTIVGGYRLFRGGDLGQKFAGGVAMAAGALDAAFNVATAGGKKTLASGVKAGIRRLVGGASKELIEAQSKALGRASLRNAAKSIATPQGPAIQSMTAEAQVALRQALSGAPVYRAGGLGTQRAAEGQYWSFQNPASTPGYANRMGMPGTGAGVPFIMGGRVNPSSPFITREAPGIGNNLGGSVEAVTQPGDVTIDWFHMP